MAFLKIELTYAFLFLLLAILLLVSLFFGILLIKLYKMYIQQRNYLGVISSAAKSVRYGNLSKRIKIDNDDKISKIFENINKMIESLEDREEMVKAYQIELEEQKEFLESIFNALSDGLVRTSEDFSILGVNPTVLQWLNKNESDVYGKKFFDFFKFKNQKENYEDFSSIVSLSSKEMILDESFNKNSIYDANICCLNHEPGNSNFVISLRDITKAKELDNLRDDFVATLSHDLRVPIIAESNTLKLLYKGIFGGLEITQKEAIRNILQSNNDLLRLVNSLLDTYKFESGKSELEKKQINPSKLIKECLAEFESMAKTNSQTLDSDVQKDLPKICVDRNELKRVLRNLISNAITFTPKKGSVIIKANKTNNELIVEVKDDGRGINKEDKDKIFDRYYSSAKKFRKVGTGLGLYLSKKIIEGHGGKIWVESEKGQGASFFFAIPYFNSSLK